MQFAHFVPRKVPIIHQGLVVWPWLNWAVVFFRPFGYRAGVVFSHFKPHLGQNKCTKRQIAQLVANALGCGRAFSSDFSFWMQVVCGVQNQLERVIACALSAGSELSWWVPWLQLVISRGASLCKRVCCHAWVGLVTFLWIRYAWTLLVFKPLILISRGHPLICRKHCIMWGFESPGNTDSLNNAITVTSLLRSQQKLFYCPAEATRQASLSDKGAGGPLLAGRTLSLCKSPSSGSVTVHQPNHQSVNLFFPLHQRGRERRCCVQSESRCSGERASGRGTHSHTRSSWALKSDKFIKRRPLNEPAGSAFVKDSQRRNKVIKGESIQCDAICIRCYSIPTNANGGNGF